MSKTYNESELPKTINMIESARKRPGMFIGTTRQQGVEHLVKELIANVIDLFLKGNANWVKISVNKKQIQVSDDGPGLPFLEKYQENINLADYYLTHYHNSATADGHAPHVHLQTLGLGLVIVNAFSKKLKIVSFCDQKKWTCVYKKGIKCKEKIENSQQGKGTIFTFTPDDSIFPVPNIREGFLRCALLQKIHLFPGFEIRYNKEKFCSENGLADFITFYQHGEFFDHYLQLSNSKPFSLFLDRPDFLLQVAAIGKTKKNTLWLSWANGSSTREHGSHVDGFKKALRKAKWKPAMAMIHIVMKNPKFAGPTKGELNNPEIISSIMELLSIPLEIFPKF